MMAVAVQVSGCGCVVRGGCRGGGHRQGTGQGKAGQGKAKQGWAGQGRTGWTWVDVQPPHLMGLLLLLC